MIREYISDISPPKDSVLPLVSVIMPAYNHQAYISASMRSIAEQTYSNVELIIIDDGSTDETPSVIAEQAKTFAIPLIAIRKKNGGACSALNAGMARARGSLIALVASDDRFLPHKIERQVSLISEHGARCGLVHCEAFDDDGSRELQSTRGRFVPAQGECFEDLVARRVTAIAPSILFRREAFDKTDGFDESLVGEDLDFYAAVANAGYSFAYDPEPMVIKRLVPGSLGGRIDLLYKDPFITLEKYRDRFSKREYLKIENSFYGGMGKAAAGVGNIKLSWHLYSTLAKKTRDVRPIIEWVSKSTRFLVLKAVGPAIRLRLKALRARSLQRRRG